MPRQVCNRRNVCLVLCVCFVTLYISTRISSQSYSDNVLTAVDDVEDNDNNYKGVREETVINSSTNIIEKITDTPFLLDPDCLCKIPDISPFHPTVLPYVGKAEIYICNKSDDFTYIKDGVLFIDPNRKPRDVSYCRYKGIFRPEYLDDDLLYFPGKESEKFNERINITNEFIQVNCYNSSDEQTFVNFHYSYSPTKLDEKKPTTNETKFNVLMIMFDSVSRLTSHRYLQPIRTFMKEELQAFEMLGYSKTGENTFPNMITLLTGKFERELNFTGKFLDNQPWIWQNFSGKGYNTFLQDNSNWPLHNHFQYEKMFSRKPTDFYDRQFQLAVNVLKKKFGKQLVPKLRGNICIGGKHETEMFVEQIYEFVSHSNSPYFMLSLHAIFTHQTIASSPTLSSPTLKLLSRLKQQNYLDNTVLILFGDHGMRFNGIRLTFSGWLEERMPMMFLYVPPNFRKKYPRFMENLKTNTKRLVTLFDLHETLLHILSGLENNFTGGTKRGMSLFEEIPSRRSCEDAGIIDQYCVCDSHKMETTENIVLFQKLASFSVEYINSLFNHTDLCEELTLKQPDTHEDAFVYKMPNEGVRFYFETVPGNAQFEAYFRNQNGEYILDTDISRVNEYGKQSDCVTDKNLKKFCYCKIQTIV